MEHTYFMWLLEKGHQKPQPTCSVGRWPIVVSCGSFGLVGSTMGLKSATPENQAKRKRLHRLVGSVITSQRCRRAPAQATWLSWRFRLSQRGGPIGRTTNAGETKQSPAKSKVKGDGAKTKKRKGKGKGLKEIKIQNKFLELQDKKSHNLPSDVGRPYISVMGFSEGHSLPWNRSTVRAVHSSNSKIGKEKPLQCNQRSLLEANFSYQLMSLTSTSRITERSQDKWQNDKPALSATFVAKANEIQIQPAGPQNRNSSARSKSQTTVANYGSEWSRSRSIHTAGTTKRRSTMQEHIVTEDNCVPARTKINR